MDIASETVRKLAQAQGVALAAGEADTVAASLASLAPARRLTESLAFEAEPAAFAALLAQEGRGA